MAPSGRSSLTVAAASAAMRILAAHSGDGDGQWTDPRLNDPIFTKYYASSSATKYRWPENGKSDIPYDTGYALNNVPLPVTVQCPDGTTRTLPSDLNQNSVTASPIPIAGGGPPPHVNNGPESTAYPGSGSRRQSLARYGTISRSPSMPSLREERIKNYNTMTLPRNARFRQQALVNTAGRRASYVDGSSLEN